MTRRPPLLVAIVGGSGSGKTWLAEKLQNILGHKAARISLDDFYRDRSHLAPARRAKLNFDHPRAIDWGAFEKAIRALRAGRGARIPQYDFSTHCRLRKGEVLKPAGIILVDGLWLLRNAALRRLFEVKIFMDCPARTRLKRRLARDVESRGRNRPSVQRQFRETVEPMHRRFVLRQARWADVVLRVSCDAAAVEKLANVLLEEARDFLLP